MYKTQKSVESQDNATEAGANDRYTHPPWELTDVTSP